MTDGRPRALVCHPDMATDAVRAVAARVWRAAPDVLALAFVVEADLQRVRVPEPRPPQVVHGLWQHTCCEAFVRREGGDAYHELNLAPSGEWAAYAFDRYRDGLSGVDAALASAIAVRRGVDRLELEAQVALARLSRAYLEQPLRVALAAVVEEQDGRLSYWALYHAPGPADFHHADAFMVRV